MSKHYKNNLKKRMFFHCFLNNVIKNVLYICESLSHKIKKMQIAFLFRKCVAHVLNNILTYKKANINHLDILNSLH